MKVNTLSENNILRWMKQREPDLTQLRHQLHREPELGHAEYKTTHLIRDRLLACGAEILPCRCDTGVAALIRGGKEGPLVALREDIDALPITENTGLPFASCTAGVSHSCGHDIHTTALLGCAQYLCENRSALRGSVMLIFQCAEECCDGAMTMLDAGLFDVYRPERVLGFHCAPSLPLGKVGVCRGAGNASCDTVTLRVIGKGGHGAHPELCVDPVLIAAYLLTQVQTVISREKSPADPSVLTFGTIRGGTAPNVIPNEVVLQGTLRTFSKQVRSSHKAAIERIAVCCAQAMNGSCEVRFEKGMPPLINAKDSSDAVVRAAEQVLGEAAVDETIAPSLGSDDFSCLLDECGGEGIQFLVGTGDESVPNSMLGLHVAENIFPDAAIVPAAAVLAQTSVNILK